MKQKNIGQCIRELRLYLHLSQKDLARDICTQSLISQIELGEVAPSADILYQLANRMGIDINYFFDVSNCPRHDYLNEVIKQIRLQVRLRNYDRVYQLIQQEKENPVFQIKKNKQFLLWHEGVCLFYLFGETDHSLKLLHDALHTSETTGKNFSERQIEILNSIAIIHSETEQYTDAIKIYRKALTHFRLIPSQKDHSVEIRILYNYAKALTQVGDYTESLRLVDEGIKLCLKKEILSLLGELQYQKGKNLVELGDKEKAIDCFAKAMTIFELKQNKAFMNIVKDAVSRVHSA